VTPLFRSASTTHFDRLYRQHAASVYRYARAVLGNHADAEDVTQQTFLNAYRALAQGTKPRKAENWIFTIAHNEVRRHLRDTRAQKLEVELDEELADRGAERSEPSVTDVLRALQYLTPNQRSALVMREFEGRSYAEIAKIMDVSQGALETLMFRARRSLAEALEDGLTCAEAELAVSRRLDGRLSRREARRLKKHVRECQLCKGFELKQRRQRSLLEGLSVIPIPASLLVFRGEQAAAAVGGGAAVGAAAAGGSAGIAVKAAAVAAAFTVAGGVGYSAGTDRLPVLQGEERRASKAALAPAAHRSSAEAPLRVAAPSRSRSPVTSAERTKRAAVRPTAHKPAKTKLKAPAAKVTRKATKTADRPQPPEHAARPLKAKTQHVTPTRKRPVHEPKAKEVRTPTKPERPASPAVEIPVTPAPLIPPGLEKKLLEPPKPEKPKPEQ
jgi:RNA polymerase sigma factor (sigma-70 family)